MSSINSFQFTPAKIVNSDIIIPYYRPDPSDEEQPEEPLEPLETLNNTFILEILHTEYEQFFAIVPFIHITQEYIDIITNIYESLSKILTYEVICKIIQYYIIDTCPELITLYNFDIILNMYPHYILNNSELKIYPDINYDKEYIKNLIQNKKLILGSKNHFGKCNKNINILDKEDSEYISSYFHSYTNTYSPEWRCFTSDI